MNPEIAWASGLFEGEGCIYASTTKGRRYAYACLWSTDEDVVARFILALGFQRTMHTRDGHKTPAGGPAKKLFGVTYTGAQTREVIRLMWDGLGERRRTKAYELGVAP